MRTRPGSAQHITSPEVCIEPSDVVVQSSGKGATDLFLSEEPHGICDSIVHCLSAERSQTRHLVLRVAGDLKVWPLVHAFTLRTMA